MNYKYLSFLILFLSSLFYADESLNASELECLPDAKVEFWAKGDAYLNGIKQVDKANCYTETDLADSLKVLYNLPDAAISNIRNEAGNSLTEYFNYGSYKTPQTILYAVSVNGQTLSGCRVSVSVLDKLPPYCNDNDPENKKFQLVIDADPMTCKVSAEMVDAELAKHVNDANTHAMNDKIWFRSKAGSNKSVAGSGIKSIEGNWDAMNADGLPTEFPVSNVPYTVYYKVSDAAGNTRERTAYDNVAVDGVYPYCYATVTVRKPSPACGNPTITLPATASKCRYDADEVFAELGKMESAGYVCGEERLLEQVIHDKVYRYGVKENFTYKVNSVQCVAQVDIISDKIDCPALSLKKVYDKKGLCNASIADTVALYLKKALQKNADCRINAEYCYIPDGGLGNPVKEDGIATYRFTYLLVDANNKVIDDACEAPLVVADASKPACPASSLKLIVPVGPDCIAIAGEAVDFFDNGVASVEKGKKSNCSGASLFADISAFKYVDETTKDEKVGGIIGDMVYDFDWNTSVPLLYRIASNSEFVNPNYCTANVFVKDDAEIRCPDGSDINISTTTDGTASFPTSQLVAPLVCRPNAITATYALKDGNGVEKEISLADLPTYSFAAGTYILSATFSREATDFQSASQKTCSQSTNVADATDPVCPSVSETGIRLKNTVCGLDLAGVKTLIELEVGNDRRLDNATNNAELRVTGLSGEPNIVATKEELPHLYTFNLEDKAGNKASCNVEITLIDEEVPSCPETRNVDLTIGNECQTATEVTITGDDNCEIATINWWCDESPKTEYLGSECTVKLENLT
ncbi:MAG: hypothetical protein MJZ02_08090 [Paludibacteraceae bacterium]|nr:hypothetical protein [Paludibacteraceae bacterium]